MIDNLQYKDKWVHNWFSNLEPFSIEIDGIIYPSVENYYQSQKTLDLDKRKQFENCNPYYAKKLGKTLTIRPDWEQVKFDVMEKALRIKFTKNTEYGQKLMQTEGEIVEWNNWGDKIWGKTLDGKGENRLGKILMKIRDELNDKISEN